MLENILRHLGYIKESRLDEDYLCDKLGKLIQPNDNYVISKEADEVFFKQLKGVQGMGAYLGATAAADKDRYFGAATDKEREFVRGAFARTVYLMNKVRNSDTPVKESKIKNLRYKD